MTLEISMVAEVVEDVVVTAGNKLDNGGEL
jgi:hypothetical protein